MEVTPGAWTSPVAVQHRCYTGAVPTKYRRHAITETPTVRAALDELREELKSERIDLGELVVLGAREKLAQARLVEADRATLRRRLADRVRRLEVLVDPDAAEEVRRTGWARS
jgi:hypothetical protein